MPRKKSPTLTEAELRVMEVLWQRGESTVADVVERLRDEQDFAYSTILTILRILERKGYVDHTQQGRAFVYRAVVDRDAARQSAIRHLVSRFFDDSPELLVLNVLERERIDVDELRRLKELVEGAKGEE